MKTIKIFTSLMMTLLCCTLINVNAQQDYGNFDKYSINDLDFIQDNPTTDYRTRKKGDRAMSLYYFVPFDLSIINSSITSDSNVISDNKHRVTEKLVPNLKLYLSDKSNLVFGIYYKRTKTKYEGDVDTTVIPSTILNEKETFSRTGIYARIGYEKHLAAPSFRKFDLDFYAGGALSFGLAPTKYVNEETSAGNAYNFMTVTSNSLGLGLDLYTGVNFQFDNFSVGAEIIAFGLDVNKGVGKSRVQSEISDGTTVTTIDVYTHGSSPLEYSKLKVASNQTSMYRGIRFSVCYYFQRN